MCKLDLVSHTRQELRKAAGMELDEVSRSMNDITEDKWQSRCLDRIQGPQISRTKLSTAKPPIDHGKAPTSVAITAATVNEAWSEF